MPQVQREWTAYKERDNVKPGKDDFEFNWAPAQDEPHHNQEDIMTVAELCTSCYF